MTQYDFWLPVLRKLALESFDAFNDAMDSEGGSHVAFVKEDGDPATHLELRIEELSTDIIDSIGCNAKIYSEEQGLHRESPNSEFTVHIDPVDGTAFALRRLPGACFAVSVFDNSTNRPIAACVKDYTTGDYFEASLYGTFLNGSRLTLSSSIRLKDAFISTCYGKNSRIKRILEQPNLLGSAFWVSTTGGMLDMARISTGQVDAYIDTMLGFKTYDFAAGAFIAQQAGASVAHIDGTELAFPHEPSERVKFIVASNSELLQDIVEALQSR